MRVLMAFLATGEARHGNVVSALLRDVVRLAAFSALANGVPLRWVYTFDAVKRFDTLSYASQMRIKAFCGVSVYTFQPASARVSAREKA